VLQTLLVEAAHGALRAGVGASLRIAVFAVGAVSGPRIAQLGASRIQLGPHRDAHRLFQLDRFALRTALAADPAGQRQPAVAARIAAQLPEARTSQQDRERTDLLGNERGERLALDDRVLARVAGDHHDEAIDATFDDTHGEWKPNRPRARLVAIDSVGEAARQLALDGVGLDLDARQALRDVVIRVHRHEHLREPRLRRAAAVGQPQRASEGQAPAELATHLISPRHG
jgi:hypothetical protein